MTLNIYYKDSKEINEIIKSAEKIEEIKNNLGTFIEITDEGGQITNLTKRLIERIEIV